MKCNDNRIQGTYIPIGRAVDNPTLHELLQPGYLIYARSELDSYGEQWYFIRLNNGQWSFTWDDWLSTVDIDLNDVDTG